jgi:hypothetical protein
MFWSKIGIVTARLFPFFGFQIITESDSPEIYHVLSEQAICQTFQGCAFFRKLQPLFAARLGVIGGSIPGAVLRLLSGKISCRSGFLFTGPLPRLHPASVSDGC